MKTADTPKTVHIIGGGTMVDVRPHFQICASAGGTLARNLYQEVRALGESGEPVTPILHLSFMASEGSGAFRTNQDLRDLLDRISADPDPSIVFMTAAVADFEPHPEMDSGKQYHRLKTSHGGLSLPLVPSEKIIRRVRSKHAPNPRKDIFLVGCKTTTGATDDEMFLAGLKLLKDASCNLVLVNDIHRRHNMIVTPEQARYGVGLSRGSITSLLLQMAYSRSQGNFTRSTVVPGEPISWEDPRINDTLRQVVNHCIREGAYKDLLQRDATVGHFAQKLDSERFLTSRRSQNFNDLQNVGLVLVEAEDDTRVTAYGSKPSVGGQSQRIIFREHPEANSIVHFHSPPRTEMASKLPIKSQLENECGSHECGQNTSKGLAEVEPGIKVVYLDQHGPNIVFHESIGPNKVIDFIDRYFDLSKHTGEGDVPAYAS